MNLCFQTNNNCGEFCLQTAKVWWRLNQSRDWQKCLEFFLRIFGIFGLEALEMKLCFQTNNCRESVFGFWVDNMSMILGENGVCGFVQTSAISLYEVQSFHCQNFCLEVFGVLYFQTNNRRERSRICIPVWRFVDLGNNMHLFRFSSDDCVFFWCSKLIFDEGILADKESFLISEKFRWLTDLEDLCGCVAFFVCCLCIGVLRMVVFWRPVKTWENYYLWDLDSNSENYIHIRSWDACPLRISSLQFHSFSPFAALSYLFANSLRFLTLFLHLFWGIFRG